MPRDLVFISYSHQDSVYLDEILRMMSPLMRAGKVRTWSDRDIAPGRLWRDEIEAAKARTAVALLLVSAEFLASDFINDHELNYFLEVVRAERMTLIWVLVSDCLVQRTPLPAFQSAFPLDKPLDHLPKPQRRTALRKIAETVERALEDASKGQRILPSAPVPCDEGTREIPAVPLEPSAPGPAAERPAPSASPAPEKGVIELELHLRDHRLYATPDGPPAGTPLADLRAALEKGDLAALYPALFGVADPGQRLAALDPTASLDALGLGPKRLRLRCMDDAAAGLPWHCLTTPAGGRLGDQGWIIEVVGATPGPAALRTIHNVLILAPADSRLAPEVHPHVDQVSAALAPLLPHPRLRQVPWAVNGHDLARALKGEPDLIYCYARLDASGCLALGRDEASRESLCPVKLVEQLAALTTPPLLWLHCVEDRTFRGAELDLDRLLALRPSLPLLLVQRTECGSVGRSLKRRTLAWLAALAATPTASVLEPAEVLSRLGDPGTCARLGQDGLRLARPGDPDDVLYAAIYASLIQLLLGRTFEKDLLRARITAAGSSLVLYFVCGSAEALIHDFPEQCHWHLEEQENPPRVRPTPIPAVLRPDQKSDELRHHLCEALQIDPDSGLAAEGLAMLAKSRLLPRKNSGRPDGGSVKEGLSTLASPALIPGETLLVSLPWLLELAPGCTPGQVRDWLVQWKQAVLKTFEADEIPRDFRVLTGCCLQWEGDWPADHCSSALALQRAAVDVLKGDNPSHCDWVRFKTPLDHLYRDDVDEFFSKEHRRLDRYTQGLARDALVNWVWKQTNDGVFEDTVDAIYRGCKTHFQALRPGGQA